MALGQAIDKEKIARMEEAQWALIDEKMELEREGRRHRRQVSQQTAVLAL